MLTLVDRPVETGGGEKLARTIAMGLDPSRFERSLCATRPVSDEVLEPLVAAGVDVVALERRSRISATDWRPLIAYLREHEVDVLHAHKFGSNVWGAPIGRLAGVPIVITHEHTWSFRGQGLRRRLDRYVIAPLSDVIVAVSNEDRRRMIEIEHISPDRIRVIANGIAQRPPGVAGRVRRELGIPDAAPVIGSVGSLRPQKALHLLIECARRLVTDMPGLRVLIVGQGDEEGNLRALVKRYDLGRNVLLLGMRHDVPDLLEAMNVCVLTSDWEGSPLAVIEYMAAGRPTVATRVGGVPGIITHGLHGLLVEPGDVAALTAAIGELLRDPQRSAELGRAARRRQLQRFTVDRTITNIELLYEELIRAGARWRQETEITHP